MKRTEKNGHAGGISRRKFLEGAGLLGAALTIPEWLASCGTDHDQFSKGLDDPIAFAKNKGITSPAMCAVFSAITAPNPHNTQAWKIKTISDREVLLFVDSARMLPETDPPGRQIHIGQGTFIEHFVIGASQIGFDVGVEILPNGGYEAAQAGTKPTARLTLRPGDVRDPLYAEFSKRATNRTEYEGPAITTAEARRVIHTVGRTHSRLDAITLDDERSGAIRELMKAAFAIETNTLSKNDESRIWFRFNDDEIFSKRDGISLRGSGMSGIKYHIVSTFFMGRDQASWNSDFSRKASIDLMSKAADTSRGFFSLITPTNTMRDWILTGRDYARLQLALTKHGLVLQPMSQALQEYPEMDQVRTKFEGILGVRAPGKIQMFVRAGRSSSFFRSPRRDPSSLLG